MSVFRKSLFNGKIAIVTGGGTGIGKAITQELVSLGCKVVIASRKEEVIVATAKELNPNGRFVFPKVCNIRKQDEVQSLIASTISELGSLDFLVNNGGGQFPGFLSDMSLKGWNAVIETNLTGTFIVCQEAYNQWMSSHGGAIVNIIADYFRGFPLMGHTGAARAAVDNLTKTLSIEWASNGVRINSVAPGSNIYSASAAANYGDLNIFKATIPGIPMKRLGETQEVASAVTFLLSPGASFITGATLRVDGGSSLNAHFKYEIPDHKNLPKYQWTYSPPDKDDDGKDENGPTRNSKL